MVQESKNMESIETIRDMKEKVLHAKGDFWVTKDATLEFPYLILKDSKTYSIGFLACETIEKAIDNCNAFAANPAFVKKHFNV